MRIARWGWASVVGLLLPSLSTAQVLHSVGRVAVLQDDLPLSVATASPEYFARILRQAGMDATFVNCNQLGDSNAFNRERFDVLVLPYGPSFPVKAADNFRQFLRAGG